MLKFTALVLVSSGLSLSSAQNHDRWGKYFEQVSYADETALPSTSTATLAPSTLKTSTSSTVSVPDNGSPTSISTGTFTPSSVTSVSFSDSSILSIAISTSTSQQAGSTGNCVSVRTTIFTTYATVYSQTGTSTSTYTSTLWDATVTTEIPTVTTVYTSTITETTGYTVVPIVVIPASSTTTIPTLAGFTPILCDEAYYNPTTTITVTSAVANVAFVTSYVSNLGTYIATRSIVTGTILAPTPVTFTTSLDVTSTSTRARSTSTVYAACSINNITPYLPNSDFVGVVSPQIDPAKGITSLITVPAVDATDCCALCQANSLCAGSAYDITSVIPCGHFIKQSNNATCDSSYLSALAWSPYFAERVYISNGPCGRYTFDRSAFWLCDPNTGRGC